MGKVLISLIIGSSEGGYGSRDKRKQVLISLIIGSSEGGYGSRDERKRAENVKYE
jgi:hypothetical protein